MLCNRRSLAPHRLQARLSCGDWPPFAEKIRLHNAAGSPDALFQVALRAGMTHPVVAEIGPRGGVVGLEAAETVSVVVGGARLTIGDGTTDDRARGESADHGAGTIVTMSPAAMVPAMMPAAVMVPPVMTPAHRLRRSSRSGKRSVDRQRRCRCGLKRDGCGAHHERGGQDSRKSHGGFPFLCNGRRATGAHSARSGK